MRGLTALSIKSSSLSDISWILSIPWFTYTWQVLHPHTPPQLCCSSMPFSRQTSSTDSPSAMGNSTDSSPFASKFILTLKMFISAKVTKLLMPLPGIIHFDNPLTKQPVQFLQLRVVVKQLQVRGHRGFVISRCRSGLNTAGKRILNFLCGFQNQRA